MRWLQASQKRRNVWELNEVLANYNPFLNFVYPVALNVLKRGKYVGSPQTVVLQAFQRRDYNIFCEFFKPDRLEAGIARTAEIVRTT